MFPFRILFATNPLQISIYLILQHYEIHQFFLTTPPKKAPCIRLNLWRDRPNTAGHNTLRTRSTNGEASLCLVTKINTFFRLTKYVFALMFVRLSEKIIYHLFDLFTVLRDDDCPKVQISPYSRKLYFYFLILFR